MASAVVTQTAAQTTPLRLRCILYNNRMKQPRSGKKPLMETNPYLKVPEKYRKALITNVSSSTAIETGASVESISDRLFEFDKA